jgi:hypothetical protein
MALFGLCVYRLDGADARPVGLMRGFIRLLLLVLALMLALTTVAGFAALVIWRPVHPVDRLLGVRVAHIEADPPAQTWGGRALNGMGIFAGIRATRDATTQPRDVHGRPD